MNLKPCPFCGGKAEIIGYDNGMYQCVCRKCNGTQDNFFDSAEEAAYAWNKREIEDKQAAEIARLHDALDTIVGLFEINGGFWAVAEKMHETAKQALVKGKEE